MRSSLVSDLIQAILACILLVVLVGVLTYDVGSNLEDLCEDDGRESCRLWKWDVNPGTSTWTLEGGMDLVIVGFLQALLSYPYFDPVLTDRAFLAEPKTMLSAFYTGGIISFLFISIFGLIGVYGNMAATLDPDVDEEIRGNVLKGVPAAVAQHLGRGVYSITNIIFLTTSISTLDSTFASTAKLSAEITSFLKIGIPQRLSQAKVYHMQIGRFAIRFMALVGILPLLQNPSALSATTASGTMVLGLGAPMLGLVLLKEKSNYYPMAFLSSFWVGAVFGFLMQISGERPEDFPNLHGKSVGEGSYRKLLWYNLVGTAATFGTFLFFFFIEHYYCNRYVSYYVNHRSLLDDMETDDEGSDKRLKDSPSGSVSNEGSGRKRRKIVPEAKRSRDQWMAKWRLCLEGDTTSFLLHLDIYDFY